MTGTLDHPTDAYPTRTTAGTSELDRVDPVVWGSGPGPIDAETLAAFDKRGYLSIDRLVTDEELDATARSCAGSSTDPAVRADERTIIERQSQEVRSVFEVHKISEVFRELANDPRVVGRARQILGSDVYLHQSRVNFKPGFDGKEFYWHSDFETWHAEDGMPRMRAVSISVSLTDNHAYNGALMIMPGSHRTLRLLRRRDPGGQLQVLAGPAGARALRTGTA